MNPAARRREEKEKHPERFCPRCLFRTSTRAGYRPCPKHGGALVGASPTEDRSAA